MAKVQHTCTGCVPIDASIIDVYVTLVETNKSVTNAEAGRTEAEAARVVAETQRTATFATDHSRAVADHSIAQSDHATAGEDHTSTVAATNAANAAAALANEKAELVQARLDTADADHTRAEGDHSTAVSDHSTASSDHTTAQSDHATAGTDHTRAESDHSTAASDHTASGTATAAATAAATLATEKAALVQDKLDRADTDHTRAESDHATAASDHTTAASDHTQAGADHTQAGTDHSTAAADHTAAASDHTQASSDHTQAAADHTTAAADHTQAQADHSVMEGYDDRLDSVESEVSQLEAKVDALEDGYIVPSFTLIDGGINTNGSVGTGTTYKHTSAIPVVKGQKVKVSTAGYNFALVSKDENGTYIPQLSITSGDANVPATYIWTAPENMSISVTVKSTISYNIEVESIEMQRIDGAENKDNVKVSKKSGKNIFDNILASGYFNAIGELVSDTNNSHTKNYLPVSPSTPYHLSRNGDDIICYGNFAFGVWYDSDFAVISTFLTSQKDVTSPASAAYLRVSVRNEYNNNIQIEQGTSRTTYEAYNPILGYVSEIPDGFLGKSKINPSDIDLEPTSGSDNLVRSGGVSNNVERNFVRIGCKNIYTNNNTDGKFLVVSGQIGDSDSYEITDYLPVIPNTKYHASRDGDGLVSAGTTALCFYDYKKTHISGLAIGDGNVKTFTTPANCYFIRTTVRKEYNIKVQIEQGEERTQYVAYNPVYDYTIKESSLLGNDAGRVRATVLNENTNLTLPDFPTQVIKRFAISFRCRLYNNLFTSVSFGQNYKLPNGAGVKIDATTVYLMDYSNGAETVRMSKEHGISTFSTFLDATLYVDTAANAYITISTLGAFKKIKINNFYYAHAGVVFARSETTITDIKLSATCADFRCPVWAFGDSYFGLSAWRIGYWLRSMGFFSILWNCLGGQTATGSMEDLEKCLPFGTPKYLVWALGMNGATDISGSVNPTWLQETNKLLAICKKYGITPILCTVPTVPGIVHEALSAWIRASGYRYIDVAKAVGSQADGTWYAGMRQDDMPGGGSDTVHPSEYGAQIIAQQWLIDFPEIMQYGIENPAGENTMITV